MPFAGVQCSAKHALRSLNDALRPGAPRDPKSLLARLLPNPVLDAMRRRVLGLSKVAPTQ
jgi:hypothetical protein